MSSITDPSSSSSSSDATELSKPGEGWTKNSLSLLIPRYSSRRWISPATSWTRIGEGKTEHSSTHSTSLSGSSITSCLKEESLLTRSLIAQLCEKFYSLGWATGTGGGVSIRLGGPDESRPWRVFVAPSGIQKEDMIADDVFELDMDRKIVVAPQTPNLRMSACTPLWYVIYRNRPKAKCVIHTHSMQAQLATMLDASEESDVLRITHLEMLKGVGNHAYDDILEVPIIDNRPSEDLLADQLERAVKKYPNANAVLVRRHGIYCWGDSWEQAKTQCESFDYLFESCIKMRSMGVDFSVVPKGGTYMSKKRIRDDEEKKEEEEGTARKKRKVEGGFNGVKGANNAMDLEMKERTIPLLPRHSKVLLLDIEGCTTAISFVKEELFPYVLANLDNYLETCSENEVQDILSNLKADIDKITVQDVKEDCLKVKEDGKMGIEKLVKIMMSSDVKATGLKGLQGKMWKSGYASGEIKGHVYPDFLPLLHWCRENSIQVNIYSSGSIAAQKLLFTNSSKGDLTPYLHKYFDTTSGMKKESQSYLNICENLKLAPKDVMFVSDAEGELVAAREAGIGNVVMSIRPGNAELTLVAEEFPNIFSLLQLCGV